MTGWSSTPIPQALVYFGHIQRHGHSPSLSAKQKTISIWDSSSQLPSLPRQVTPQQFWAFSVKPSIVLKDLWLEFL